MRPYEKDREQDREDADPDALLKRAAEVPRNDDDCEHEAEGDRAERDDLGRQQRHEERTDRDADRERLECEERATAGRHSLPPLEREVRREAVTEHRRCRERGPGDVGLARLREEPGPEDDG